MERGPRAQEIHSKRTDLLYDAYFFFVSGRRLLEAHLGHSRSMGTFLS
jgi:hypothetical protein